MSKIGRRPIALKDVKVDLKGQEVHYTGKNASGVHVLPEVLEAIVKDNELYISAKKNTRLIRQDWGLHRALVSNKITGAHTLFEKQIQIVGLGYKAISKGDKLEFNLGFSHKIEIDLPKEVTVVIDKSGQLLTFKSFDREILGKVCGELRELKPVEPYKGTGVRLTTDVIIRKAGKTKAAG
jgi:large subunit ribosomal protein L6